MHCISMIFSQIIDLRKCNYMYLSLSNPFDGSDDDESFIEQDYNINYIKVLEYGDLL